MGVTGVHKETWMEAIVLLSQRKYTLKVIFNILSKIPDKHVHLDTCDLRFSPACLEKTVIFMT